MSRKALDRKLCRELFEKEGSVVGVHRALKARGINVIYGTVRRALKETGGERQTKSRFPSNFDPARIAKLPPIDSAALVDRTTLYPSTVVRQGMPQNLLKSGYNSSKIGGQVLKGKWKGMPIYTLTLEERATCPTSCHHWRSCFGNKMHLAQRISHKAPGFAAALVADVERLGREHPGGFVVRLHVLGDFFSVPYVKLWEAMLDNVLALRVFGYTARWDAQNDPIARALVALTMRRWERFAMRFSDAPIDECATVSIEHPVQAPGDAIVCPEQMGKTESCSTCGLCWQSRRRVAFLQH